jgi:hypothetical protein
MLQNSYLGCIFKNCLPNVQCNSWYSIKKKKKKKEFWAAKMNPGVKGPVPKPHDLSSIPRTHKGEGDTHTNTHTKSINQSINQSKNMFEPLREFPNISV